MDNITFQATEPVPWPQFDAALLLVQEAMNAPMDDAATAHVYTEVRYLSVQVAAHAMAFYTAEGASGFTTHYVWDPAAGAWLCTEDDPTALDNRCMCRCPSCDHEHSLRTHDPLHVS